MHNRSTNSVGETMAARDLESQMLAHDIHDGLVQPLVAATMYLDAALAEPESCAKNLIRCRELLSETILEARRLANGHRPRLLDEVGLIPAIHQLLDSLATNDRRVARLIDSSLGAMSPLIEGCVFRICQEALANIVRHSKAKEVSLVLLAVGGSVHLRIEDDGQGIDPSMVQQRGGIAGIARRAGLLGGEASFSRAHAGGTHVVVEIPAAPIAFSLARQSDKVRL